MILINEEFSLKKDIRCWEVHKKTPSLSKKSKTGFKVDITFHPNLVKALQYVVLESVGDSTESTQQAVDRMTELLEDIKKICEVKNE